MIQGFTFDEPPQVLYEVYLDGRAGGAFRRRHPLLRLGPDHAGHPGADRVVLDATEALRALGLPGDASPNLIFEPDTGIEEHPTDEAARSISPRANVRFRGSGSSGRIGCPVGPLARRRHDRARRQRRIRPGRDGGHAPPRKPPGIIEIPATTAKDAGKSFRSCEGVCI